MWTILKIILISVSTHLVASEEFIVYTHESIRDDNGKPCLTGCSPDTHECIINWKREKRSCKILDEIAPIYQTSQYKDAAGSKYCLSNCGPYDDNYKYDWCYTSEDFSKWDFCSMNTNLRFLVTGQQQSLTSSKETCTDQCAKGRDTYFWCHYKNKDGAQTWDTCALAALPRIPVLQNNFHEGEKNKGKCDDFLRYDTDQPMYSTSSEVPDNFVTRIAEAIEAIGNNTLTQVFTLNEVANPVKSYSMVKIKDLMVPAVIRAHITKDSVNLLKNDASTSLKVQKKLQQQMLNFTESYEAGTLIGFDLGGPNAEYNIVPRSHSWKCGDWADMEEAVINWCRKTGGSVDLLIVVFYRDTKTPVPKAFGASLVFRNTDHSLFVDCREKIYWNNFGTPTSILDSEIMKGSGI
ncbi:hypothetical protein ABMA28_016925 [Loxostege sticticalis]|uniref:Type VII secretion system protein EssD-like domain-containing protein n=1 Tax=Loxostege sticticalis TaxID=481309 RepID=A0ABD0T995_LOXSC